MAATTESAAALPLVPIRSWFGRFHLLVDGSRSVLLDAGLAFERRAVQRALVAQGLGPRDIAAILLTHGHLDHAGNLAELQAWTGAPIYAHPAEQAQLDGTVRCRGAARVGAAFEALGRTVLRYRPARITHPIADEDELPFWGGLRVVHLPGHTDGHCGFYSAQFGLFFVGDLFASYPFSRHRPPAIFNTRPELLSGSLKKAAAINAERVVPNHTWSDAWDIHAFELQRLARFQR